MMQKSLLKVVSDQFEPVSKRTLKLTLMPRKDRATQQEQRCGLT